MRMCFAGRLVSLVALAALGLNLSCASPAQAGTVGTISGTVIDAATHAPIANVKITAASPSGTYQTRTDAHGYYAVTGVVPDTYTVSFEITGYDRLAVNGVSVFADQVGRADVTLHKTLKTIANVESHSVGSAFQPNQPQDTYTVNAAQVHDQTGNSLTTSLNNLLVQMPGVSIGGGAGTPFYWHLPVIRGGFASEVSFNVDGVPVNDQMQGDIATAMGDNQIDVGALSELQVTPGLSDASFGNSGNGSVNFEIKRGRYPGFYDVIAGVGGGQYMHALNVDYGIATPNNRWSEYLSYNANNYYAIYADNRYPTAEIGVDGTNYESLDAVRNFTTNTVYHWGKNNKYSLQLLYQNELDRQWLGTNVTNGFCFFTCNQNFLGSPPGVAPVGSGAPAQCSGPNDGLTNPSSPCASWDTPWPGTQNGVLYNTGVPYAEALKMFPLFFNQTQTFQTFSDPRYDVYPRDVGKLEFGDALAPSTFLQARVFTAGTITNRDWDLGYGNGGAGAYNDIYGSFTNGVAADAQSQLSAKNLLKVGTQYDKPIPYNTLNDMWDPLGLSANWEYPIYDFIPPGQYCPLNQNGSAYNPNDPYTAPFPNAGASLCGYVYQYLPNVKQLQFTPNQLSSGYTRTDFSYYADDRWTPNSKLTVDFGARMDTAQYDVPPAAIDPKTCITHYIATNWKLPTDAAGNPLPVIPGVRCPTGTFPQYNHNTVDPTIFQPRLSAAWHLAPNDAIRGDIGKTTHFANEDWNSQGDSRVSPAYGSQFAAVPAFFNAAVYCGPQFGYNVSSTPYCTNYAANPTPNTGVGYYNDYNPFPCPSHPTPYGPCTAFGYANMPNPSSLSFVCGLSGQTVPCTNYAEELQWIMQNYNAGNSGAVINLVQPSTYNIWSLSYEHFIPNGIGRGLLQSLTQGVGFSVTAWGRTSHNETVFTSQPIYLNGKLLIINGAIQTTASQPFSIGVAEGQGFEARLSRMRPYGLSVQFSLTAQHSLTSVPSYNEQILGGGNVDLASLLNHALYPINYITPLSTVWDLSYRTHHGLRVATQLFWNEGYPTGAGLSTYAYFNGLPQVIPNTNAAYGVDSSAPTSQYVDPFNPGSLFKPNVAAKTGTSESMWPGGQRTPPQGNANITIEQDLSPQTTIGFTVNNLFDAIYTGAQLNSSWQAVATGVGGPYSGTNLKAFPGPLFAPGNYNVPAAFYGAYPYTNIPQDIGRTYYLYVTFRKL